MPKFASLLRGINVSGQKIIPMADLRTSMGKLGFDEVQTYLQSGNIIFHAENDDPKKLASDIQNRIGDDFGHQVEVLVKHCGEINQIANSNPYLSMSNIDTKFLHVTFPFQPVTQNAFDTLELPTQKGERAILSGLVVYLYCPNGYGRTKLNNRYFEKAFETPATTRNWKTVLALANLCMRALKKISS